MGLEYEGAAPPDPRAALILRLALQCCSTVDSSGPYSLSSPSLLSASAPSFTHLLLGYDIEPSMGGLGDSILLPRAEYSLLTIIERALTYQGFR